MVSNKKLAAALVAAAGAAALLPAASANAASAPRGEMVICNHSGYIFDLFADGPSSRTDDLAGNYDECTDWARVLPGNYDIGYSLRIPSQQNVIIQARIKREGHVIYKVFKNSTGILKTNVAPDKTTRVDLFIPRG